MMDDGMEDMTDDMMDDGMMDDGMEDMGDGADAGMNGNGTGDAQ